MNPFQDALWVQDRHGDVDGGCAMRFSGAEFSILSHLVEIADRLLDCKGWQVGARLHHELIGELEDGVRALGRVRRSNLHEQLALLSLGRLYLAWYLALNEEVLINDSWPVHVETVVSILLLIDLSTHKRDCILEGIKVIPSVNKPARYFTTFIAVFFEELGEGAGLLRMVCLDLVVRMELGACLIRVT